MENVRRIALTLGLVIAFSAAGPSPAAEQALVASSTTAIGAPRPSQVIPTALDRYTQAGLEQPGINSEQIDVPLVDWALGIYAAAGLDLPDIVVRIHPSIKECDGKNGLYWSNPDTDIIDICTLRKRT